MTAYLPTGLTIGDGFQLVFVTSTTYKADTAGIAYYNTQVNNDWNSSTIKNEIETYLRLSSITWYCIGSTSNNEAKNNAVVSTGGNFKGVYRLDQAKVADDYAEMWGTGSGSSLQASINIDENNTSVGAVKVWTGSTWRGERAWPQYLGVTGEGSTVYYGMSDDTNTSWIANNYEDSSYFHPLYALSEILYWVPETVVNVSPYLPSLRGGDTFQLAFVTETRAAADQTDISYYNNFVNTEWSNSTIKTSIENILKKDSITWYCIGSTAAVDAKDNAIVGDGTDPSYNGVFRLDGLKIADNNVDMYGISSLSAGPDLDNVLSTTQNSITLYPDIYIGNPPPDAYAWTGSTEYGEKKMYGLNGYFLGSENPGIGTISRSVYAYLNFGQNSKTTLYHFYALSEQLEMPTPPIPPPPIPKNLQERWNSCKNKYYVRFPYERAYDGLREQTDFVEYTNGYNKRVNVKTTQDPTK